MFGVLGSTELVSFFFVTAAVERFPVENAMKIIDKSFPHNKKYNSCSNNNILHTHETLSQKKNGTNNLSNKYPWCFVCVCVC